MKARKKGVLSKKQLPKTTRTIPRKHKTHPLSREVNSESRCSWCGSLPLRIVTREELLRRGRTPKEKQFRNAKWPDDFPLSAPTITRISKCSNTVHAIAEKYQLDVGKLIRRLNQGPPSDLEDKDNDYGLAIALRKVSGRKRAETELKHARKLLEAIRYDDSTVGRRERECAVAGIIRRGEEHLRYIDRLRKQYKIPRNITSSVYKKVLPAMAADIYRYLAEIVPGTYYRDEKAAKYKTKALELTKILVNAYYGKNGVVQWLDAPLTATQIKSYVQNR